MGEKVDSRQAMCIALASNLELSQEFDGLACRRLTTLRDF